MRCSEARLGLAAQRDGELAQSDIPATSGTPEAMPVLSRVMSCVYNVSIPCFCHPLLARTPASPQIGLCWQYSSTTDHTAASAIFKRNSSQGWLVSASSVYL